MSHRSGSGEGGSQRPLRVGEEIRRALAKILLKGFSSYPYFSETPITVTEVRVSPDLKNATAFILPLGGKDVELALENLALAAPLIRSLVSKEVKLKSVPLIRYMADKSYETAARIDNVLYEIKAKRPLTEDEPL